MMPRAIGRPVLLAILAPLFLTAAPEISDVVVRAQPVPQFGKLEMVFQVRTIAQNLQFPFDPSPPPGVPAGTGVSVDALFTPDNWKTVHRIPAFYYQEFLDEIRSGREWFYPSGAFSWRVRFSPPSAGSWQFRIVAQDSSGVAESQSGRFEVTASSNPGFIRVSRSDSRYFEYGNGEYFPGLGYNMRYDEVSWRNPVLDNVATFRAMRDNGIQLIRIWLSQWAIFGSEWNPWSAQDPALHGQYLPYTGITFEEARPESEVSMKIAGNENPCMFIGVWKAPPAVKRDTRYRVRILYKAQGIKGPRLPDRPFGFVAKTGDWLWGDGKFCMDPGTGDAVTAHQPLDTPDWTLLEGAWDSGSRDFLPNFFLTLENVTSGTVWVDHVSIQEDLGGGRLGPNIASKPWMAHHQYFEQRNSYAFDKLLALAGEYDIYLRLVLHEKNDRLLSAFNDQGVPTAPDSNWFYGNQDAVTKVRWLQQAFWRYAQARWGYSRNIHSWELLNEGDPYNGRHYTLADEFGKFMQCRVFGQPVAAAPGEKCMSPGPNAHMVTTSFWHSFPRDEFWANPAYPNVSFADVHKYVAEQEEGFADSALATLKESAEVGATQAKGAGKPVIRGETAFVARSSDEPSRKLLQDRQGVWLHDFIWAGLNAGGLTESYWYVAEHIYNQKEGIDHRHHFRSFFDFVRTLPLNNGHYEDARAEVSNSLLRVCGQKDLRNGRAHLWIQNRDFTWQRATAGEAIQPAGARIQLTGFRPGRPFLVEWWDTWQDSPDRRITRTETLISNLDGSLTVSVKDVRSDLAVRISPSAESKRKESAR